MTETSDSSVLTTSVDTGNATSSPGSVDGLLPCDLLAGLTTIRSGQEAAHVSPSASRGMGKVSTIHGTCGHSGARSSRSASLQSSLESRLRQLLHGSTLCAVIWKPWATPLGVSLSRPRAVERRTKGTASGLLPTPSGTSNHGTNHVVGRLDEWGGSSNRFRWTEVGKLHLPGFELWVMGYHAAWRELMPPETPSLRKLRRTLFAPTGRSANEKA